MAYVLLAGSSAFFSEGAFAVVLLCAGLAIGLAIGRRQIRHVVTPHRLELQRLIGLLAPLVDWTRGLAEDMSQYRSVVCGGSRVSCYRGSADLIGGRSGRVVSAAGNRRLVPGFLTGGRTITIVAGKSKL